jgi:hypothetical protein
MAEAKILIPAYKRTDSCPGCGAAIYSPDLKDSGGWPLMSACVCAQRPKVARAAEQATDAELNRKEKLEETAQAA